MDMAYEDYLEAFKVDRSHQSDGKATLTEALSHALELAEGSIYVMGEAVSCVAVLLSGMHNLL